MFNWSVSDTKQYMEPFNFDLCKIGMFQIELFDHFTECKQMTDI